MANKTTSSSASTASFKSFPFYHLSSLSRILAKVLMPPHQLIQNWYQMMLLWSVSSNSTCHQRQLSPHERSTILPGSR